MARIPVSGNNDEALTAPGTDVREIISGLDPDGDSRVFMLEEVVIANEHISSEAVVEVYDADEDTGPAAAAQRLVIHVPAQDTVMMTFPGGRKYVTNCVAGVTGGTISTNGGISASGHLV